MALNVLRECDECYDENKITFDIKALAEAYYATLVTQLSSKDASKVNDIEGDSGEIHDTK